MGITRNSTTDMESPPAPDEAPDRSRRAGRPEEAELLRAFARGEEAAYLELVERHGRYLYGVAYSLSGNPADAEDLVQETFVAALSSTFRGEAAVRTWLVQILVRRAAMLRRNRGRGGGTSDIESAPSGDPRMASVSGAMAADARMDLAVMLKSLTPEHREVIVLRELEGMSYDEMATSLGVPLGTIESRLYRARAELKKRFAGYL